MRLAIVTSHPIQYYSPIFRELARHIEVEVFFASRPTPAQQGAAGFGTAFDWDVDLLSGFASTFLANRSAQPGTGHFGGCDTPDIGEKLSQLKPDVLLVTGWHLKSYVQATMAARRRGIPVIVRGDSTLVTPRGLARRMAKGIAYPLLLRVFAAACYVGERSRRYYRHYGVPEEKLFHSPHCVDTDWFGAQSGEASRSALRRKLNCGDDKRLVLFAGKLQRLKRPLDLVAAAALARLNDSRIEVMVAGDGEMTGAMRKLAAEQGVPLHMLGFQNQSQMPQAYAAADLLVLPSESETWGLVVNEALACGCPVLVSEACGCAGDLGQEDAAGIFPTGDVTALAARMLQMLQHPPSPGVVAALSRRFTVAKAADGIRAAASFAEGRANAA